MTLDEAIKHCEETAKEIRKANEEMPTECKLSEDLCACAKEHEQLAGWLKDYKRLLEERPQGEWKPYEDDTYICTNCLRKVNGMIERIDHFFCKEELSSFCPNCGAKMT